MLKTEQKSNDKIGSIQGLRALACLLIIISHCGFFLYFMEGEIHTHMVAGGAAGVSIFIVLSGYLVGIRYCNSDKKYEIKKHILKLYPLHIITMCAMAVYLVGYADFSLNPLKLEYFITNILLIQSFIPDVNCYFSLNAVAWYLSLNAFICICTPLVILLVKKFRSKSMYAIGMIFLAIVVNMYVYKDNSSMHFYIYINPLTRILEFVAGAFTACLMKDKVSTLLNKKYYWWILEMVAFAALIVAFVVYPKFPGYFTYRLLFFPISILLVASVAAKKSFISKWILDNPISRFLGKISGAVFLVQILAIHLIEVMTNENSHPLISFLYVICICIFSGYIYTELAQYCTNRISLIKHRKTN